MGPETNSVFWQVVASLGSLLGLIGVAFALGYNWRRVTVIEGSMRDLLVDVDNLTTVAADTYARKDLMELEMRAVKSRLDHISKQIEGLQPWPQRDGA